MPETLYRKAASPATGKGAALLGRCTKLLIALALCLWVSRSARGQPTGAAAEAVPLGPNHIMVSNAPAPEIEVVTEALGARQWAKALRLLSQVLEKDPTDAEAAYLQAVASRELAKTVPYFDAAYHPTNRHNDAWSAAIERFEDLISRDSAYRDVLYQYALLWRYAEEHERAMELGRMQLRLRPELLHAEYGLFRAYRAFLYDNPPSAVKRWKKADNDMACYFYGEALRLSGELLEAELALRDLLWQASLEIPVQPILLSLARIYYAQDKPERAEERIDEAVENIGNRLEADLIFDEIAPIVSDEELKAYRSLKTPEQHRRLFESFWMERDPAPSLPWNARMAEHYRRLLTAEQKYVHTELRLSTTDPDETGVLVFSSAYELNEIFDDKGLVYIRHGEPAEKIATGGFLHSKHGGSNLPDDMNVMETTGGGRPANPAVREVIPDKSIDQAWKPNESWRYDNPRMDFHFVVEGGGSNWRLAPTFPLNEAAIESREHWSGIYVDLAHLAYLAGEKPEFARPIESLGLRSELERKSRRDVRAGLTSERHSWPPDIQPFDVPFFTATFRGTNGQSRLELHYTVPTGLIAGDSDTADSIQVEMGLALHDAGRRPVVRNVRDLTFPGAGEPDHGVPGHVAVDVRPDSYQVAFHMRPKGTRLLSAYTSGRSVPDFSAGNLAVSDLVPAYRVDRKDGTAGSSRSDFRILANPSMRFSRARPVHLYFEIYNLAYSTRNTTQYLLSYELSSADPPGPFGSVLGKESPTLTLSVEHEGAAATSYESSEIDVGEMSPGRYRLEVRITDRVSGATASTHTFIDIY